MFEFTKTLKIPENSNPKNLFYPSNLWNPSRQKINIQFRHWQREKQFKRFQNNSKRFQKIQNNFKKFKTISKNSKEFQKIQNDFIQFKTISRLAIRFHGVFNSIKGKYGVKKTLLTLNNNNNNNNNNKVIPKTALFAVKKVQKRLEN